MAPGRDRGMPVQAGPAGGGGADGVAKGQGPDVSLPDRPDAVLRVEKCQVRWGAHAIDDEHVFAQELQHVRHPQLTAQTIAVRPDMAGQQKSLGAAMPGEVEGAARAIDDCIEHQEGLFGDQSGAGLGGSVDDEREISVGKREIAHVALMERQRRRVGQVRVLFNERLRIAREDDRLRVEIEPLVRPKKAFQQPHAEKACAAGDENALAAHIIPCVPG